MYKDSKTIYTLLKIMQDREKVKNLHRIVIVLKSILVKSRQIRCQVHIYSHRQGTP